MTTPKELREISAQGAELRKKRIEEERKEQERKEREKRMEKYAKDHAEAQRRIANIECDMKWAAEDGRTSIRIGEVYSDDLSRLEGIERIIADHFKGKGFEVDIETLDGPEIRFEPDYNYFLRVSW